MAAAVPFIPLISGGMSILGGIMGKTKTPTPSTPSVMPTQDSALTAEAKRRALIQQQQRGGRASTVLSDNSDNTFGGN